MKIIILRLKSPNLLNSNVKKSQPSVPKLLKLNVKKKSAPSAPNLLKTKYLKKIAPFGREFVKIKCYNFRSFAAIC